MLDKRHSHRNGRTHHHRHHGHHRRRHGGQSDPATGREGEVRLVLLALVATGLRDGRLSLARAANGRGLEVRAAAPEAPPLLPAPAEDQPGLRDADPDLLPRLPLGRRRRGKARPVRLTAISRR